MADTLKKVYKLFEMAQTNNIYKKSYDNLPNPTPQAYDELPEEIKEQYPKYIDWKNAVDASNNTQKGAMQAQLALARADILSNQDFTVGERQQYHDEIKDLEDSMT